MPVVSITSQFRTHRSAALAGGFARLAAFCADNPDAAAVPAARIALDNLFRILEMYRYDAFEDEERVGVLARHELGALPVDPDQEGAPPWHQVVRGALEAARLAVYPTEARETAILEAQDGLRQISRSSRTASLAAAGNIKRFWTTFDGAIRRSGAAARSP